LVYTIERTVIMRAWMLALAFLLVGATVALGHALLVRSEPANKSSTATAPKVVRAWFNEELRVQDSTIIVSDARGRRVDDGKGGVDLNDLDRKSMMVRLGPLPPGTYTVKWKAVSVDDLAATTGAFTFFVRPRK